MENEFNDIRTIEYRDMMRKEMLQEMRRRPLPMVRYAEEADLTSPSMAKFLSGDDKLRISTIIKIDVWLQNLRLEQIKRNKLTRSS